MLILESIFFSIFDSLFTFSLKNIYFLLSLIVSVIIFLTQLLFVIFILLLAGYLSKLIVSFYLYKILYEELANKINKTIDINSIIKREFIFLK